MTPLKGKQPKAWVVRFVDLCLSGMTRIDAYVSAKGMSRADIKTDTYAKAARTWASQGARDYREALQAAGGATVIEVFQETPESEVFVVPPRRSDALRGRDELMQMFEGIAFNPEAKDKDKIAAGAWIMKCEGWDQPEKKADGKDLESAAAILALPDTTKFVPKDRPPDADGGGD
jgi:hypothetical protein